MMVYGVGRMPKPVCQIPKYPVLPVYAKLTHGKGHVSKGDLTDIGFAKGFFKLVKTLHSVHSRYLMNLSIIHVWMYLFSSH